MPSFSRAASSSVAVTLIGGWRSSERVEDALPGKLRRHALDLNCALGLDRLLGDVHIERAALDVHVADEIGGDGLVEPRHRRGA